MGIEEFNKECAKIGNKQLIEMVEKQITELAKTGGRSHRMTVPPRVDDTDMLLCELVKRFKACVGETFNEAEALPMLGVSNNEVAVCDHPDEALIMDKPTEFCLSCGCNIPKQTDC